MEDMRKKVKKGAGGFISEFKSFALKGNVIDLAVGVIIGGAFGKITTSVVNLIMPAIGLLLGGVNFTSLELELPSIWEDVPPAVIKYGELINNIVDFFIIAFAVFLMVKAINKLRRKEKEQEQAVAEPEPPPPPEIPADIKLLTEIRDLLLAEQQNVKNGSKKTK